MSEDFHRAIVDLDQRNPGANQDARQAILREIHTHPGVDPNRVVAEINRVENSPGHAHNDVQLVNNRGYLDVVPLQNYGYQQPGGYPQPGAGYYPPEAPPQAYYPQPQPQTGLAILGALTHRRY
jgi:hypothetical protein